MNVYVDSDTFFDVWLDDDNQIETKGSQVEHTSVNSAQPYELKYLADKLGVSTQTIVGAKRATGSNDRADIEKYIKGKKAK
ncbi:DUF3606 domain-containing protein [Pedobacter cryoconitis]|uniref:Uncharacterized protein DUF3606 n=1 Tax=Pedobacter cryoconitis TaxID=188932 RepID=A0A327SCQ5_9SPHI|nr:DUF3606 domain-containing protein [Pedobacter cryoconitis]RAJ26395.1 uncharacterized protein DUF3606 [Pedobacter cryoconitis]